MDAIKTLRYEIEDHGDDPDTLIFALHGYGQLVKYFIRKFSSIENVTIVAPEGMHRFYLSGASGRVGASWMTKEAREDDIADNIRWLDQLHDQITKQKKYKRTILLGFSQGGATAARWLELGKTQFDGLILWACVYPPDLQRNEKSSGIPSFFVLGDKDEFYQGEAADDIIRFYRQANFEIVKYSGSHDIDQTTLKDILLHL